MNNLICFIPARGGSKSILKKNIKELKGKPLIVYSIQIAFDLGIQRVIVNTDDEKIAEVAKQYGAEVMIRSKELAQDDTSMYEVLKNEIFKIQPLPELVLLLQPTSPFRKKIHIKIAISLFSNNLDKYDSLISVEKVPEKYNPAQVIIKTQNGHQMADGIHLSQRITRRQLHKEAFVPTGSIYLFKVSNLEKGSIYGEKTLLLETEPEININSLQDWKKADKIIKQRNERY